MSRQSDAQCKSNSRCSISTALCDARVSTNIPTATFKKYHFFNTALHTVRNFKMHKTLAISFLASVGGILAKAVPSSSEPHSLVRRDTWEISLPNVDVIGECKTEQGVDDAPANDCAQMQQQIPYDDSVVTDPTKAIEVVQQGTLGKISVFFRYGSCAVGTGTTVGVPGPGGIGGGDTGSGPYTGKELFDLVGSAFLCNGDGLVCAQLLANGGDVHVGNIHE
jgi:hypothetical protein